MMVELPRTFNKEESAKLLIDLASKILDGKAVATAFTLDWSIPYREIKIELTEFKD